MEHEEGPGLRDVDQTWMLLPQDVVVPQPENPDREQQQCSTEASKHSRSTPGLGRGKGGVRLQLGEVMLGLG